VRSPLRWLLSNLSTLILSFALAVVVWISAVTAANPNIERVRSVPLEAIGLDPDKLITSSLPAQVRVTLRAPTSVMDSITSTDQSVRAWVDLSGLEAGTHEIEIEAEVEANYQPADVTQISPEIITVTLEPLLSRNLPVQLEVNGEPAVGYQKGQTTYEPANVTVSGAESLVSQVDEVRSSLDISDSTESIDTDVAVVALNTNGEPVSGVTLTPDEVRINQPIFLQGGYRNVIVRVITAGQPASGYKLSNITVSPVNVVVFSSNPQLVNDLPGYVDTEPVQLEGIEDDFDTFVALNLPEEISVVGDQTVLVRVSIAAIEGSLTLRLPVVPIGLMPTMAAEISPPGVDVILAGPVPVLNEMQSDDIRVIVDLTDLELGTYQLEPVVDVLPDRVVVETILPATVEVTILIAPTPTATLPASPTPLATPSP
jgi:YbbR domain-containing protein